MEIPKAKELQFSGMGDNAPELHCNYCNKKTKTGLISQDIPITGDSHLSIVVCSTKCAVEFKIHPDADRYIIDLVHRIRLNQ